MARRQLRIGTFLSGTGSNMGSWRHPEAVPDGAINFAHYLGMTRRAEAAKLDFVFFGDGIYISEPIDDSSYPVSVAVGEHRRFVVDYEIRSEGKWITGYFVDLPEGWR